MGSSSNTLSTYTQRLSRGIDAAYDAYDAHQPDAETRLYDALLTQAQNIVWHGFGQPDETLAHDITVRAMQAVSTFRRESAFSTWFWTLAHNEVNRALRTVVEDRERLVPIVEESDEEGAPPPTEVATPSHSGPVVAAIDLEKLVRGLPPEQAEVFRLHKEGYSLRQIAEITGVSLGTARSRHRLAKEKAKKKAAPE